MRFMRAPEYVLSHCLTKPLHQGPMFCIVSTFSCFKHTRYSSWANYQVLHKLDQACWEQWNPPELKLWIPETSLSPLFSIYSQPAPYLGNARVGGVQKTAEERVSVGRADGGGSKGEEVMIKQTFSKELVKESRGIAQGTSEPRVLDGNIHNFSAWSILVQFWAFALATLRKSMLKESKRRGRVQE